MTALEGRAVGERLAMRVTRPLLERLPRGDGHAVLVLPGMLTDDRSTEPLRDLLRSLGYRSYGWRQGINLGPTQAIIEGLSRRVDELVERNTTLSLVGWSMGGMFARAIARERPNAIRQVITLGSPIRLGSPDGDRGPLPVPTTSVYSRSDGIVHWSASLVKASPRAENVEIIGSHCGLGVNPSVAVVIADRLALPEGSWTPFEPPWWLRMNYPTPADFDQGIDSDRR
jgi:pimeloyl-ACP methyl ester carboxylesterase